MRIANASLQNNPVWQHYLASSLCISSHYISSAHENNESDTSQQFHLTTQEPASIQDHLGLHHNAENNYRRKNLPKRFLGIDQAFPKAMFRSSDCIQ